MTTETDKGDDVALDALFAAGRKASARPSPDFMARLDADMEAALPRPVAATPAPPPRRGWLAAVFAASGLTGAALAGLWIGFAMPETLDPFTGETETVLALSSILPGADLGSVFDE